MYDIIEQIPIGVQSYSDLKRSASKRGGIVSKIPRRNINKAVQVTVDGRPVEVWVEPRYYGYKRAWEAVFGNLHNYKKVWENATGEKFNDALHVDHVLARSIASKLNYRYVRIFPVSAYVNTHNGRSFERKIVTATSRGNTSGRSNFKNGVEYMDILGFAKMLNYPLEHAFYNRKEPPESECLSKKQNVWFYKKHMSDPVKTLNVMEDVGLIWWKVKKGNRIIG